MFVAYTVHHTFGAGFYAKKIVMADTLINVYACWTNGSLPAEEYVNDTTQLGQFPVGDFKIRYIQKFLLPSELDSIEPCLTNPYYDSTFLNFTVTVSSSINTVALNRNVILSPNPATKQITIQSESDFPPATTFQLFNLTGQMVLQKTLTDKTNQIPLYHLSKGMYLYRLVSPGHQPVSGKLAIE